MVPSRIYMSPSSSSSSVNNSKSKSNSSNSVAQRRLHFCQPHELEHTKKKTYRRKNFRTKANEDDNDDNSSVTNNNSFFSGVKFIHSLQENADTFVKHVQSYRITRVVDCLLYTSPSPRDVEESRMPSSA